MILGAAGLESARCSLRSCGYNRFLTQFALTPNPLALYNHATRLHLGRDEWERCMLLNRRRIAWGVAICYLWASALSGMWHNHSGDACCAPAHAEAEHHAASHGAGHSHGHCHHAHGNASSHDHALAKEQGRPERCPSSDDDCVVCRFVAQSALRTLPAPEPYRGEQVAEVRQILPVAPPPVFLACGLARAPPALG